jgi:hypothetical protein
MHGSGQRPSTQSSGSLKFERSELQRPRRSLVSATLTYGDEEKHAVSLASFLAKLTAHYRA